MNEHQTNSWIFLALAVASQNGPVSFEEISLIADGINHAVPTQHEMQTSISYLVRRQLIEKMGTKYSLTPKGVALKEQVSVDRKTYLEIWQELEKAMQ